MTRPQAIAATEVECSGSARCVGGSAKRTANQDLVFDRLSFF